MASLARLPSPSLNHIVRMADCIANEFAALIAATTSVVVGDLQ